MMYGSWDMIHDTQRFLSFWTVFCSFTSPRTPKIKILKNWKKITWRYDYLTQMHQKSWSYATLFLRYDAWQMSFLFFVLANVLPFTPLTTPKINILKKLRKHLEISSFYTCVPKIMIIRCMIPEIWCVTDGWKEKVTYRGGCQT